MGGPASCSPKTHQRLHNSFRVKVSFFPWPMRPCSICTPISSPISLLPNLLTHLLCCSSNTLRHTCSSGTLPFLLPVTSFCYYEQSEEVKKACFFASFLSLPNTIFSVSPLFLSDPSQNSNSSLSTIFSIPLLCFIFILSPSDILYVSFSISLTTI